MLSSDIRVTFEHGRDMLGAEPGTVVIARSENRANAAKTEAAALVMLIDAETFLSRPRFSEEVFGPFSLIVKCRSAEQLEALARRLDGQLTATVHGSTEDLSTMADLLSIMGTKAGRLIVNGWPTGVEVCHAMQHGGPWPATSDARFTSVGSAALERFIRPVCYQDVPQSLLPDALKDGNPLGIMRMVEGSLAQH